MTEFAIGQRVKTKWSIRTIPPNVVGIVIPKGTEGVIVGTQPPHPEDVVTHVIYEVDFGGVVVRVKDRYLVAATEAFCSEPE